MEFHVLSRDIRGFPIGRHKFFAVLLDTGPSSYQLKVSGISITSRLIGQRYGLILGAHNIRPGPNNKNKFNRLKFEAFQDTDLSCALEFFTDAASNISAQFNYRSTEGKEFFPKSGNSDQGLLAALLSAIDFYVINEQSENIAYPPPWFGKNSNSWVNSILDVIPIDTNSGKVAVKELYNLPGADAAHDVRISPMYFKRVCTPCDIQNPAYR